MTKQWYDPSILGKPLTGRQTEIMELMCLGKSNAEIGLILGCATPTVKNHTMAIRRKIGASNRTLAVAKYLAPQKFKKDGA